MPGRPIFGGQMLGGLNAVGPMHGDPNPVDPMQGGPMQGGPNAGGPMQGGPVPAELTESPEMPGLAVLPTDSWPEIASAGGAVARPPRPPVAVATVRAGGR
jgi:hypothetical protein